jgi:hypothetical protein
LNAFKMSRALDQGAAAAVMTGDSQAVYKDIVKALSTTTSDLLEIEFLGKSHPLPPDCNFLLDGNSIAVPKLKLVQAFVVARQLFFKFLKDFKEDKFQDIQDATTVILLMDPEHITAANARKKMVQKYLTGSKAELEAVLRRELLVIDSLLTSHLHRHTKSPTLWGHRRWLLQISKSVGLSHDVQHDLTAVILVAAERHPKNYYAWHHMRWLLQSFHCGDSSPTSSGSDTSKVLSIVKDWCLRHPADTSGWSFFLFYLFSVEPSKDRRIEASSSIVGEVLSLATSFRWTHESVWVFLRTLVAAGEIMEDQKTSFFKTIEASITAQHENTKAKSILRSARDWCSEYSVSTR